MWHPKNKIGPIFACFYPFFHVKLRAQVQDLQKREFYDLPEHGTATTKARCGLGTVQTSWARRAIKIMAVDSCDPWLDAGWSLISYFDIFWYGIVILPGAEVGAIVYTGKGVVVVAKIIYNHY